MLRCGVHLREQELGVGRVGDEDNAGSVAQLLAKRLIGLPVEHRDRARERVGIVAGGHEHQQ